MIVFMITFIMYPQTAFPSYNECEKELKSWRAKILEFQAYRKEVKDKQHLMEVDYWIQFSKRREEAWFAATWVTWHSATLKQRWEWLGVFREKMRY